MTQNETDDIRPRRFLVAFNRPILETADGLHANLKEIYWGGDTIEVVEVDE